VAFVPARGGSKGLPRKNLAEVGGVSLVGHAVRLAMGIAEIDEVVVSSDDEEILAEGRRHGARVDRRPSALASDTTSTIEVLREYLDREPEVEVLVLLQPTSPLRDATDVRACLVRLDETDSAVTVTDVEHPVQWTFELGASGRLEPVLGWEAVVGRRQEAGPAVRLNGAVYAVRAERVRAGRGLVDEGTIGVTMPAERSIDIDDELDLAMARWLHERREGLGGAAAREQAS
jgi:CMP-N,N'-diacetyllegionaminic acid synthase